jgi:hypothetical protein
VKQVLQDYDFILISERMDESLVAMAMVMGIPVEDLRKALGAISIFFQPKERAPKSSQMARTISTRNKRQRHDLKGNRFGALCRCQFQW